jgi:hypothetical protein
MKDVRVAVVFEEGLFPFGYGFVQIGITHTEVDTLDGGG